MRRILTVVLLAFGGTFAMSGVAAADIGDIQRITIDQQLFGDASSVEVTGSIRCQATVEYGLLVGVAQDAGAAPGGSNTFNQQATSGDVTDIPADSEGVGAFGPNFDPPTGISDNSPCSQSLSSYDVVVQQNRDSDDFSDTPGTMEVIVMAGSSAESGDRGPGPFLGDLFAVEDPEVDFDRTR